MYDAEELCAGVAELFEEAQARLRIAYRVAHHGFFSIRDRSPSVETAKKRERRATARAECKVRRIRKPYVVAAEARRAPCPHCGELVELREGVRGALHPHGAWTCRQADTRPSATSCR